MVRPVLVAALMLAAAAAPAPAQTAPSAQTARPRPAAKKPAAKPAPKAAAPEPAPAPPPAPVVEPPPADVKLVTAYTQGAQVSQNTTYIRGARQRVEFPGMVSLDQCDLQRTILLSPPAKKFRVQPYPGGASTPTAPPAAEVPAGMSQAQAMAMANMMQGGAMPGQAPRGGVVTMTTVVTDTAERQPMFGLEARRIKTVVTRTPSKDACEKTATRTEIDAWYVDLPRSGAACSHAAAPAPEPAAASSADQCHDRVETRVAGDATLGFPVKTTTTIVTGEGEKQETSSTTAEVTALEITRLDAALFDVPADFTEAKSLVEMTPAAAAGGSLADALFGSTADGTSQAAPKRSGVVRIGVLEPVNKSGRTTLQMRAVRQELVDELTKGNYDALPLKGSTPEAVLADASRLQCDYVLLADVLDVKTSKPGKLGGMMKMASGGGPAKDKHEVKMSYRLYPADGSAAVKASGEVKADNGSGFGLGSALRMASFAGSMAMGFGGMRMMRGFGGMGGLGMGMGMMNPMYGLASAGGMGAMGGGFFDPRSMAMTSMALSLGSGMGAMGGMNGMSMPGFGFDPADQEVFQVATDAAGDVAKAVTDKLKGGR